VTGRDPGSIVLAIALMAMALGCGWLIARPSLGPKPPKLGRRRSVQHWLWDHSRPAYVFCEKTLLGLGGLACLVGAFYVIQR